jgi:hypothetical protein
MVRMILNAACAATLLGCALATSTVQAAEPPCVAREQGVPMLSKIPYIHKLFKNVSVAAEPVAHDNVQTVWEWETAATCPLGQCEASAGKCDVAKTCEANVCVTKTCPVAGREVKCGEATKAGAPHCVVIQDDFERIGVDFDFAVCENVAPGQCQAVPARAVCVPSFAHTAPVEYPLVNLYASFVEKLNTVHAESREREMELIDGILEVQVENAALTAKLEAVEVQTQLAIENALLKAKLEQVEQRLAQFELEQEQHQVANKATAKRKR